MNIHLRRGNTAKMFCNKTMHDDLGRTHDLCNTTCTDCEKAYKQEIDKQKQL